VHKSEAPPWILLTNDDGADSPVLVPLLRELSTLALVRAVVPAAECSWTGKVISRFKPVPLAQIEREGWRIWTLDGYPADCANIGIHSLFPTRPALVVSGINLGTNAGLAFFLSSGTIGAAVEGMLAGLPAAAFSVELPKEDFALWRRERRLNPGLERLLSSAAVVTRQIVEELLRAGLPEGASLLSVNMPASTTPEAPRRLTGVTRTAYGALFARHPSAARLDYRFSVLEVCQDDPQGDVAALAQGAVAIAPIRFCLDVEPTQADRRRFERNL
jgi:5'-nucleotidase